MKNDFIIEGDVLKMFIKRKNGDILTVLCDASSKDIVSQYRWCVRKCGTDFYATNKNLYMHRLLAPGHRIIDHINRNSLDNRLSNLRPATYSQNSLNAKSRSHNKLGTTGVYKRRDCNRFMAYAKVDGKRHYFGLFKTHVEAIAARNKNLANMGVRHPT